MGARGTPANKKGVEGEEGQCISIQNSRAAPRYTHEHEHMCVWDMGSYGLVVWAEGTVL